MNNITTLATTLSKDKWLIDHNSFVNLCKLVYAQLERPQAYKAETKGTIVDYTDEQTGQTAFITVSGILMKGASPELEEAFGLVNTDYIQECVADAIADPSIKDIVMIWDSPGGTTLGIEELGRYIASKDLIKPIYSWTESGCNSAAYWLASQTRYIGMTPSANIGSVGVYTLVEDISEALAKEGIKIQSFASGKYKLMGHNHRALTEEESNILQTDINAAHEQFKSTVLAKRNIPVEQLEGLSFEGPKALEYKFVDIVVDNFDQFLTSLDNKDTSMKSYTKEKVGAVAQEAVVEKSATAVQETVIEKSATAVPGVPGTSEEEKPEEKAEEKPEDHMCPHCGKKLSDPVEPHDEPDEDDTEEKKAETPEEKPEEKPEDKKEETPEETPEEKSKEEKKALTNEDWKAMFGHTPQVNAFVNSAYEFVKEFNK